MKHICLFIFGLIILFFYSCKEDEYVYPPVYTEMMELKTDESGAAHSFVIDAGQTYQISNSEYFTGLNPDTIYRVIGIYELLENDNSTYVYSLSSVFSHSPLNERGLLNGIKRDPVDIESIWMGGGYLNFSALVKIHSISHTYHFVETEIKQQEHHKTLFLHFYHDRNDDIEGYTQRTYFSLPLKPYENILSQGDSICFSINTYKEGVKNYLFPF